MKQFRLAFYGIVTIAFVSTIVLAKPLIERENEKLSYFLPYTYGVPDDPSETWTLSAGGRLYDNWYVALGKTGPLTAQPSWPSSNKTASGPDTWRCVSCHGWDYRGKDGPAKSDDNGTGFIGIQGALGKSPKQIIKILFNSTHQYTNEMINQKAMVRLAKFISVGQDKIERYVRKDGTIAGDVVRGKNLFQNLCATCHGFDGKSRSWGAYVGTEANANPWAVFHKLRNGNPGFYMPSLRGIPVQLAADVLAYAKTLPVR